MNAERQDSTFGPTAPAAGEADLRALGRLLREEDGAMFLEFLIVLFPFMFILFGVIQVGLIVMASFYTNYANFMALRTASVWYEMKEDGFISQNELIQKCEETAGAALGPIEPYIYRHYYQPINRFTAAGITGEAFVQKLLLRLLRVKFNLTEGTKVGGKPVTIKGVLDYEYPLVAPFAGGVIAAFGKQKHAKSGTDDATNRVMHEFVSELAPLYLAYPSLVIHSSDDLNPNGSPPFPHEMVVQRRWTY
jgi:hypothetical protein